MIFDEEQRAAASRLQEISARLDAAAEQASAAQIATGQNIATALVTAMNSL